MVSMAEIMRLVVIDLTRHVLLGFQFGALGGGADFGEAQEDEVEESFRTGTVEIRFCNVGCRLCRLGGVTEAFSKCGAVGVHFGWGNPDHDPFSSVNPERQSISNGRRCNIRNAVPCALGRNPLAVVTLIRKV
jgi:hypothetical protein